MSITLYIAVCSKLILAIYMSTGVVTGDILSSMDDCGSTGVVTGDIIDSMDCCGSTGVVNGDIMASMDCCGSTGVVNGFHGLLWVDGCSKWLPWTAVGRRVQ